MDCVFFIHTTHHETTYHMPFNEMSMFTSFNNSPEELYFTVEELDNTWNGKKTFLRLFNNVVNLNHVRFDFTQSYVEFQLIPLYFIHGQVPFEEIPSFSVITYYVDNIEQLYKLEGFINSLSIPQADS